MSERRNWQVTDRPATKRGKDRTAVVTATTESSAVARYLLDAYRGKVGYIDGHQGRHPLTNGRTVDVEPVS